MVTVKGYMYINYGNGCMWSHAQHECRFSSHAFFRHVGTLGGQEYYIQHSPLMRLKEERNVSYTCGLCHTQIQGMCHTHVDLWCDNATWRETADDEDKSWRSIWRRSMMRERYGKHTSIMIPCQSIPVVLVFGLSRRPRVPSSFWHAAVVWASSMHETSQIHHISKTIATSHCTGSFCLLISSYRLIFRPLYLGSRTTFSASPLLGRSLPSLAF